MYRRSGIGYCLVLTLSTHKVETDRKGIDGKPIIVDMSFNPLRYALNYARVYQTPVEMGNTFIAQKPVGHPYYGPRNLPSGMEENPSTDLYAMGGVYEYRTTADIDPVVQEGDKIYFKPRTLGNPRNYLGQLRKYGKDLASYYIYKVPYENIFCRITADGQIQMVGNWVLVEPIYEDWDDILVPTYYPYTDRKGNKIKRPKEQWLQKKAFPEHDMQRGILRHVGKPLRGGHWDIEPGARVVFKTQSKPFYQKIEGMKYMVMYQDTIYGELLQDVKIN